MIEEYVSFIKQFVESHKGVKIQNLSSVRPEMKGEKGKCNPSSSLDAKASFVSRCCTAGDRPAWERTAATHYQVLGSEAVTPGLSVGQRV
ncbi:MAG: hypothetical protein LBJ89_01715 [Holosporales bacterium]|jgi:hypothetical protein|nr:hypothetical protein [Holosporales bacterium]